MRKRIEQAIAPMGDRKRDRPHDPIEVGGIVRHPSLATPTGRDIPPPIPSGPSPWPEPSGLPKEDSDFPSWGNRRSGIPLRCFHIPRARGPTSARVEAPADADESGTKTEPLVILDRETEGRPRSPNDRHGRARRSSGPTTSVMRRLNIFFTARRILTDFVGSRCRPPKAGICYGRQIRVAASDLSGLVGETRTLVGTPEAE